MAMSFPCFIAQNKTKITKTEKKELVLKKYQKKNANS